MVLTGERLRLLEDLGDFGVHLYQKRLLGLEPLIPCLNGCINPGLEGLPKNGRKEVDDPLTGESVPVPFLRQVLQHHRVLLREAQDQLNLRSFVLRNEHVNDLLTLYIYKRTETCEKESTILHLLRP